MLTQKAIDKFILLLVNRLYISWLCLKIGRILYQYSSSLKNAIISVGQPFMQYAHNLAKKTGVSDSIKSNHSVLSLSVLTIVGLVDLYQI